MAVARADAEGWLVAVHAAVVGGIADRGANVAAEFETCQAAGQRRGAAAGRTAGRSPDVPGIVRRAVDRVEGCRSASAASTLVLPNTTAPARCNRSTRDMVRPATLSAKAGMPMSSTVPAGRRIPSRSSGRRAAGRRFRRTAVCASRSAAALRDIDLFGNDCVDAQIEALDPAQIEIEQFDSADILFAQHPGQRRRRREASFSSIGAFPFFSFTPSVEAGPLARKASQRFGAPFLGPWRGCTPLVRNFFAPSLHDCRQQYACLRRPCRFLPAARPAPVDLARTDRVERPIAFSASRRTDQFSGS